MSANNIKILLTGANGQLGLSIQRVFDSRSDIELLCTDIDDLDITVSSAVEEYFKINKPDYCINAAAYTAVDKAEKEIETAYEINVEALNYLAQNCKTHASTLIHISTDYVYHNNLKSILKEVDPTRPKGVYAKTKFEGEVSLKYLLNEYYILRTSWLYSEYGNNFAKTMLDLGRKGLDLKVVNDQLGTPTYAPDLAKVILRIIDFDRNGKKLYGTYNFSNLGSTNWFEFASKIFELAELDVNISPIPTSEYPTPAPRPQNSLLDKSKIIGTFSLDIQQWQDSLLQCIQNMKQNNLL